MAPDDGVSVCQVWVIIGAAATETITVSDWLIVPALSVTFNVNKYAPGINPLTVVLAVVLFGEKIAVLGPLICFQL